MRVSTKRSFTEFAGREIRDIHRLSREYNRREGKNHSRALLELMDKHAAEIRALYRRGDRHYVVETGDLFVLCLELIREAKAGPDAVAARCYRRYRRKLSRLLAGPEKPRRTRHRRRSRRSGSARPVTAVSSPEKDTGLILETKGG